SLIWWRVGVVRSWPEEYADMRLWRFSVRLDADWYLAIVQNGYSHTSGEQSSVAFFPGLPLAIAAFDRLLPSGSVFAGLVVVHLALVAALVYVYLLARLDFDVRVDWWALGFMLMFPAGFFFSAIYPQSLLMLGIAGALYHARRGQWWIAGAFGVLASATSFAGMLIVIPLALELRRWAAARRLDPRHVIPVALSPLGGLTYFVYLWTEFGTPLVYFESLKAWQAGSSSSILWNGLDYLRVESDPFINLQGHDLALREVFVILDLTLICTFLIAGVLLWWKVRPSYGALVIAMTLVPILFGSRLGMGGHVVVLFPAFILLARIGHEGVRMTLSIIFTLGLGLTVFFFVQGFWAG
ncbi:MAG: hypothetical protein M3439_04105, partial [Chloroflexota bacterium]|nr:hypothetical protein [Chloroflexota bacterium]